MTTNTRYSISNNLSLQRTEKFFPQRSTSGFIEAPPARRRWRPKCRAVLCLTSLLAVTVLLVSGCTDTADQSGEDSTAKPAKKATQSPVASASAQLDELIKQYASTVPPEEDEGSQKLKPVSAESYLSEIESNRQLLKRLKAIDTAQLALEARIDQQFLIGLLESEIYTAENRRIWENDASIYVPASQIGRLLDSQAVEPPDQRAASLAALLKKIPERLAAGKTNLRNPPRRFTEAAIFRTKGSIESLKKGAAALMKQSTDAGDDAQKSVDTAVAALEDYEKYLQEDLLPRSTGSWAIGKENYDYILQHRWQLDADTDSILARGQRAFAETEALAQQVSERIEPGKHWSEVYEHLKDHHPPADGIKDAYRKAIEAARTFVIEHKIVTLPKGERVVVVDTPPALRRSSPFGTFQSVDTLGKGLEGRLVLTPIEDWMTPKEKEERLRSHHYAWIPIIAVHEAYPGHHVDALITRENPRLLRKVVRESIFSEGWGLYTEEMMYDQGFLKGDDVRLTQLRNRLWRAARVILDVKLHTGQMTFDQAVDFLVDKVRFNRYAAKLDVGMYITHPTYVLGYLIGMQEITRIRDDWVKKFGEPSPPSVFYDKLLRVGDLPPVFVRESLFGDDETTAHESQASQE